MPLPMLCPSCARAVAELSELIPGSAQRGPAANECNFNPRAELVLG